MFNYPTIIIPGLFWLHESDNEYLLPQLKLNNLNKLLTNSSLGIISNKSIAHWVYNLPRAFDLAQNNLLPTELNQYTDWLYIEPTHLRVDRDRLLISEPELLQLNDAEIEIIIQTINANFAGELKIYKLTDELWLMGCNIDCSQIVTQPIINIIGENIDDHLPKGYNGIKLHSIINEVQMLLFNHSINLERKQDGLLEVNSIWLWNNYFSTDLTLVKPTHTLNNYFNDYHYKILYIDNLLYSSQYRDSFAWINKLNKLDETFFYELMNLLIKHKQINLIIPQLDKSYLITLNPKNIMNLFHKNNYAKIISQVHMH